MDWGACSCWSGKSGYKAGIAWPIAWPNEICLVHGLIEAIKLKVEPLLCNTSIQGTPPLREHKLLPPPPPPPPPPQKKKFSYNLSLRYLYWRDTVYAGERDTFSGSWSPVLPSIETQNLTDPKLEGWQVYTTFLILYIKRYNLGSNEIMTPLDSNPKLKKWYFLELTSLPV